MQFKPGESGNPGGRPAIAREFRERCQDFMSEKGWRRLASMANSLKSPHQYKAIELIASYAYGKPTQPIAGDDERPAIRVTVAFDRATDADSDDQ